ncbi:MAG: hypothetical protein IKN35_05880 [Lachnospiraceae bacterium]|jgi:hypothetical protein|nr:hypothetical protein [Lachnospiraceae bacterium]MBR6909797.1 hypothetical protein [Lachnospiraceae bacterium]
MIDWEEIEKEDSEEELKKLKIFLFEENLRIAQEKKRLEEERARLVKLQDDFLKDRVVLRDELDELNRRTLAERKRLKEENMFFDKKMEILTEGFRSLEEDRRKFEREKKAYLERINRAESEAKNADASNVAEFLFRGIGGNSLGLRKRYKDLLKIFHPDNLFGDLELSQALTKEFQKRKEL